MAFKYGAVDQVSVKVDDSHTEGAAVPMPVPACHLHMLMAHTELAGKIRTQKRRADIIQKSLASNVHDLPQCYVSLFTLRREIVS